MPVLRPGKAYHGLAFRVPYFHIERIEQCFTCLFENTMMLTVAASRIERARRALIRENTATIYYPDTPGDVILVIVERQYGETSMFNSSSSNAMPIRPQSQARNVSSELFFNLCLSFYLPGGLCGIKRENLSSDLALDPESRTALSSKRNWLWLRGYSCFVKSFKSCDCPSNLFLTQWIQRIFWPFTIMII